MTANTHLKLTANSLRNSDLQNNTNLHCNRRASWPAMCLTQVRSRREPPCSKSTFILLPQGKHQLPQWAFSDLHPAPQTVPPTRTRAPALFPRLPLHPEEPLCWPNLAGVWAAYQWLVPAQLCHQNWQHNSEQPNRDLSGQEQRLGSGLKTVPKHPPG